MTVIRRVCKCRTSEACLNLWLTHVLLGVYRCLRPLILLLDTTPCPALPGLVDASTGAELIAGGAALANTSGNADQRQVMLAQLLVGELVLATKEVGLCCECTAGSAPTLHQHLSGSWVIVSSMCWACDYAAELMPVVLYCRSTRRLAQLPTSC